MTNKSAQFGKLEYLLEDLIDFKASAVELSASRMVVYCLDMAILELKTNIDQPNFSSKSEVKRSAN